MHSKMKGMMAGAVMFVLSLSFCSWVYSPAPADMEVPASGRSDTGKEAVIVIDAGHGGMDGGASAADGTLEKDLTLSIARELEKVISDYPAQVIMTRTSDDWLADNDDRPVRTKKREDLKRRREIIEGAGADIAVSIHLNSFPQDVSVCGAQVFYPAEHEGRTNVRNPERTSKNYAQSVQKALEINIPDDRSREVMAKDDILLFRDMDTDIILVECGFLSDPEEAKLLRTAEYQRLLAESIWQGINEILYLKKTPEFQIIYSTNTIE
ncbi:MAG: N-acetylmuramoyl-L-alanine amidase [Firmicutes bacterium]|nr:N-acetylmuramoyl-L-alanine amidase [Bacillota bacterium]